MPIFGKIKDIIITPEKECLFILTPYESMTFNKHFHSYEVIACTDDSTLIYHQQELLDFHPLAISKSFVSNSPTFIRLKYDV